MSIFYISLFSVIFIAFLYFGYKDDYKRDKIGFKTVLVVVIGSLLIIAFFCGLRIKTEALIRQNLEKYYIEQLGWNKEIEYLSSVEIKSDKEFKRLLEMSYTLTKKIDEVLSIYNTLFVFIVYFTIIQFNRAVKRYISEKATS